jgi:AcrR family transcriptional regulator
MTVTPAQLGRPVGANGEETRQRILAAAMRCVAEVGYTQATIREIARAADMTSGSLYHYFPDKSELLRATAEEIEGVVLPRLRAATARSGELADRLDAVLDESTLLTHDYPHLTGFLRALRGRPGFPGSQPLRIIVDEIVEDARGRGSLSPDVSPQAAVETICALTRGLSEQAISLHSDTYDAALAAAKKLVRGTLFTRSGHAGR